MPNPTPEEIRDFVIAGHGDFDKVKTMLAAQPELLNLAYPWSETDSETAIQAASHVGNVALAEFLLAQGAPLAIYTAAMLGRRDDVTRLLAANPELAKVRGAHDIPLLPHAAMCGDVALVSALHAAGATDGASSALIFAVARRHADLAAWLLANAAPDLAWKNFQGKTALDIARDREFGEIEALLVRQV
ncbi:MAG: ankyrin repeat domain-containing protein [Anaerolineae bacterium]|nr:ankyrin repeat domain-containing protein [Anaerolineae bacterium]